MRVKTLIRLPNQFAVETLFAPARFVSRHQQNRLASAIKSESHSPFTIRCAESQFLHVRMPGAFQSIDTGPAQLRSKLLQNDRQRQYLCPHILVQRVKLWLKVIGHLNDPLHTLKHGTQCIM